MVLKNAAAIILLASIFALGFALTSQYGFGYHPCEMCIWQRWGYAAVIVFSVISLRIPRVYLLAVLALAITCAIAVFHTGVELKWWEGFSSCSSALEAGSLEDLRAQILSAPVVRCDTATWFFLGISMAAWNAVYSFCLTIFGIYTCRQKSI